MLCRHCWSSQTQQSWGQSCCASSYAWWWCVVTTVTQASLQSQQCCTFEDTSSWRYVSSAHKAPACLCQGSQAYVKARKLMSRLTNSLAQLIKSSYPTEQVARTTGATFTALEEARQIHRPSLPIQALRQAVV